MGKYYVKVVRVAVEAATIEVDAVDHSTAKIKAVGVAEAGLGDWAKITEDDDYTVHPIAARDQEDVDDEGVEELLFCEDHKFMVLFADTSSGEGRLLPEAWMGRESSLLIADVTGDWIGELETLKEGSTENYYERLAQMRSEGANPEDE